ncbi:hypothetical protein RFI_16316, partial [Reticulomyxa filosa]
LQCSSLHCLKKKKKSEDNEILQYILPQAEAIRVKAALQVSEEDLKQILHTEVNERRQELVRRRIWNYLFWHRDQTVIYGYSLFYFGINHPFRKKLQRLITNSVYAKGYFNVILDFIIVLNAVFFGFYNYQNLKDTHSLSYKILHWFDIGFVLIFTIEISMKMFVFGLFSKPFHDSRSWNKIVDPAYKQSWRARCLAVWQYMCENDKDNLNASLYTNDLGIFEVTKARDGLVVVHCVIPSTGLELRILFDEADWKYIFLCRQYGTRPNASSVSLIKKRSSAKRISQSDQNDIQNNGFFSAITSQSRKKSF